jgi:hypothetical protein
MLARNRLREIQGHERLPFIGCGTRDKQRAQGSFLAQSVQA